MKNLVRHLLLIRLLANINEQKNLDSNKFEVTILEAMYKDLLSGDFNNDLLKVSTHNETFDFFNIMMSNFL